MHGIESAGARVRVAQDPLREARDQARRVR
jgi:hypothetical protein